MGLNSTFITIIIILLLFSVSLFYSIPHINIISAQTSAEPTAGGNKTDMTSAEPTAASIGLPPEAAPVTAKIAVNGSATLNLSEKNPQPPNGTVWTYVIDSLPIHGSIEAVNKTGDLIPNSMLKYKTVPNYVGVDSFTYKIIDDNNSSTKPGLISLSTFVVEPIIKEPIRRIIVAVLIAIASIVGIVVAVSHIIARLRNSVEENPIAMSKFWDIIRSNNMDPSLSVFQFFLWTIVLMFSLFSIYLIRIFGGATEVIPGQPPVMLLALTGISFATPFVSSFISTARYPKADDPGPSELKDRNARPPWGDMLREFGKPSLSRFQMFGWTWISIAIYLFIYSAEVMRDSDNVVNLSIPDVFPILVALMGLTQVVFLGTKATVTTQIEITKIFPMQVKKGEYLSIFGLNFGNDRQDVWLGTYRIRSEDRIHLLSWNNGRIDIRIPDDLPEEADGYEIMVVKGGSSKIAFKGSSPVRIKLL